MRTLYLTFDGLTDPLGRSQILPYVRHLAGSGHQIDIVSLEKSNRLYKSQAAVKQLIAGQQISWHPKPFRRLPPVVSSLLNLFSMRRSIGRLRRDGPYDLVHCRSYMSALIGLEMKRKFACKFLFDMRGFWPDERVDGRLWNLRNPLYNTIYRFFKKKEKEFLNEADAVITLTHAAKIEVLEKNPGVAADKITVIPCCVDLNRFTGPSDELRQMWRQKLQVSADAPLMIYLGSLGTWYCGREMVDCFRAFLTRKPEAIFLVVTQDDPQDLLSYARSIGVGDSNIRTVSATPEQVPGVLAAADVGVSFILPSYSKLASSPTKVAEMLAMGLPVISNAGVGDWRYLEERGPLGPLVTSFDSPSYENAITELDTVFTAFSARGRLIAETEFSLQTGSQKYIEAYRKITSI